MTEVISASAPGKVNLHLGVGQARADGYHDLVTVFQAVDLRETVRLIAEPDSEFITAGSVVTGLSSTFRIRCPEENINTPSNLAWRAVDAVVEEFRSAASAPVALPPARIEVVKNIFVAGGMAGGSADAAAALVAADAYLQRWAGASLGAEALARLAARLGADVPFCLAGGTALGTGRGDELVPMISRGEYWWVLVNPGLALPTGDVFGRLDEMRHTDAALVPRLNTTRLAQALVTGDSARLAGALHNDLEPAAVALRPQLRRVLADAGSRGLRAIVSGSGPTVAILCRDALSASNLRDAIVDEDPGCEALLAHGPVPGARLD